jgi:hypothetical protein
LTYCEKQLQLPFGFAQEPPAFDSATDDIGWEQILGAYRESLGMCWGLAWFEILREHGEWVAVMALVAVRGLDA